jgi:3-oxoadipate enol-lactonase
MSFTERDNARIYWNALGKGEPLVLIMGLGCSSAMWFRIAPLLARNFRVILLDNRGSGLTEVKHAVVHRVSTMAGDVAAVLDAAGVADAHVFGLSMGGMIAQEFALEHPNRVRSLMLAATNCGGANAVLAEPHIWRLLFSKGEMTPEQSLEEMRPYTYARQTSQRLIDEDSLVRIVNYPTIQGYKAQLYGLMGWSSYSRLPRITCPTLVLHGTQDQLIPPRNGEILAERIAGAKRVELSYASHWLHTDQTDRSVAAIRDFTSSVAKPGRRDAAT